MFCGTTNGLKTGTNVKTSFAREHSRVPENPDVAVAIFRCVIFLASAAVQKLIARLEMLQECLFLFLSALNLGTSWKKGGTR